MMVEPTWVGMSMIGFLFIISLLTAVAFFVDKRKSLAMVLFAVSMVVMYFAILAPSIHTYLRSPAEATMMVTPGPTMIGGRLSMIGLLFILGLFFAVAFLAVKRKSLVTLLAGIAVVAMFLGILVPISHQRFATEAVAVSKVVQQQPLASDGGKAKYAEATDTVVDQLGQPLLNQPLSGQPHDPSLDALWEKLTESKIQLDGEPDKKQVPSANAADEELKKRVAREFGLGPDGSLPPDWVIHQPGTMGNVFRKKVSSDRFLSEEECLRELETEDLPQAVCRRVEQLAAGQAGHAVTVANLLPLGIGTDYILREICRGEFTGTLDTSVGEMKRAHVLLEFNAGVDNHLREAWLRHERTSRLTSLGRVAGVILAGLAGAYGLLKLDTTTHGYYSRQLLWAGLAAIIAAIVASS